ncbi:MAG: hypothetical protein ACRCXT_08200 [Paraclostridium sp.]
MALIQSTDPSTPSYGGVQADLLLNNVTYKGTIDDLYTMIQNIDFKTGGLKDTYVGRTARDLNLNFKQDISVEANMRDLVAK